MCDMKNTDYYKSGKHQENILAAREKAKEVQQVKKQQRIAEYNLKPTRCSFCDAALPYEQKRKKFCNSSCAAKFHNTGRVLTNETKQKISETLKDQRQTEEWKVRQAEIVKTRKPSIKPYIIKIIKIEDKQTLRPPRIKPPRLYEVKCIVCNKTVMMKPAQRYRKTCSSYCRMTASIANRTYQNGKKKLIKYYNKWIDKEVNLESSWELTIAEMLDKKDIEWYRPKAMKWIDATGKNRLYYCDFYLPKYDTYLDPKNPYCMELDADKLKWFESRINLIAGDIALIQMVVENLNEVNDNNQTS